MVNNNGFLTKNHKKTTNELTQPIKTNDLPRFPKIIVFMVIFQNVVSPKAASRQPLIFGDPENP